MKHTLQMNSEELARAYTNHHGWHGKSGGWIYTQTGEPIVQGYWLLGEILRDLDVIEQGVGIKWANERDLVFDRSNPNKIAASMAARIRNRFNQIRQYGAHSHNALR